MKFVHIQGVLVKRLFASFLVAVIVFAGFAQNANASWSPEILGFSVVTSTGNAAFSGSRFYSCLPEIGCTTCPSITSTGTCAAEHMRFSAMMPSCDSDAEINCIESLQVSLIGGDTLSTHLSGQFGDVNFSADPKRSLSRGGPIPVYSSDKYGDRGTQQFVVIGNLEGSFDSSTRKFKYERFSLEVTPVHAEARSYDNCYLLPGGQSPTCLVRDDFLDGSNVELKIRLNRTIGSWLWGRLGGPQISVKRFSESASLVSVKADSISAPVAQFDLTHVTPDVYAKSFLDRYLGSRPQKSEGLPYTWLAGDSEVAMEAIELFGPLSDDTSSGVNTVWELYSDSQPLPGGCKSAETFQGLITSNATAYLHQPPILKDGVLDYQIAALHFLPDGKTPFLGTYNMLISKQVAACIYKFDASKPVRATVSISSSDGKSQVGVSSMAIIGDYYSFKASGFGFSNPHVRVALKQATAPVSLKIVTLRCTSKKNPKLFKLVKGSQPRCPVGFKKS